MSEYSFLTKPADFEFDEYQRVHNFARNKLKMSKRKMFNANNRFRRDRLFKIGDTVFIKIQTPKSKLSPLFKGPCTVVKVHNTKYSYDVEDPQGVLYQVHVNNMK